MPAAGITVTGNLAADPELRHTANGTPVVNFTVAHTPRVKEGDEWRDGETLWLRCTAWQRLAENVKASLGKGDTVLVVGRLSLRTYETAAGVKGISHDVDIESVGADLRRATVSVVRNAPAAVAAGSHAATADKPF